MAVRVTLEGEWFFCKSPSCQGSLDRLFRLCYNPFSILTLQKMIKMASLPVWTSWQIHRTQAASAEENMRWDAECLEALAPSAAPILHFYEWQGDCATYGHFVRPEEYFNLQGVAEKNLSLAKRPTGGGIIFHSWDLAFSVLIPSGHPAYSMNTLANYALINDVVKAAIEESRGGVLSLLPTKEACSGQAACRFCMANPTQYDVMVDGKKVGGAAQRRRKQGFLHQGSISLVPPTREYLHAVLLEGDKIASAMGQNSYYLFPEGLKASELAQEREALQQALIKSFVTHIE